MDTVGTRVRREREAQKISRSDFAKRTGIGYSTIAELERGGMQTTTKLRVIAEVLGVSQAWLETGKAPKEISPPPATTARPAPPADAANDDWTDVTGYAQAAGLGSGPEAAEWAETHKLKFRKDSLSKKRLNPKALAVMYGAGDSMEPTIKAGDAILFDTTDTNPKNGSLYVLLVPGAGAEEYAVKRANVSKGAVTFVSDNLDGDHNWKEPRPLDGMKVVGRVRWTGGWVK